ncbi:uncharacterized protein K02A2.6-like [Rhagoletis pomonella]|uniref:uncharacterized protein K02A2.6-like n=1 Tax=Rhagoletis pomonella TaxID=28610 RepID=UPI0017875A8A|nr:uncharacterized protein K02A2.6-like [Rhagoletis pomonella]
MPEEVKPTAQLTPQHLQFEENVSRHIMSTLGNLEPFNVEHPENWSTYYARFELYLLANDVQGNDRQRAVFLTLAGAPLYDLLSSLASPRQVSQLSINEIKMILTNHFSPRPSEIAAYYKFHKRDQKSNEGFSEYVAALRKLAVDCNFGTALDRMLRDRLVCGLRDEALQRNLLAEPDLKLQKVLDRAATAEAAFKHASEMRHSEQVHHVASNNNHRHNRLKTRASSNAQTKPCNGCGGSHARCQCPHRETICSSCGTKGHLQRVCRSSASNSANQQKTSHSSGRLKKQKPQSINQILPLVDLKKSATISINGYNCTFEIDSGSNYTIMSSTTFERVWPVQKPIMHTSDLELVDFQRNRIPIMGVVDTDVSYGGREVSCLPVVVVDGNRSNVLGCNWFTPLGITIQGVNAVEEASSIKGILKQFNHLFAEELGCFKGKPVSLYIDKLVQPIRYPPRRIPLATKGLVEAELDRLCSQGILEPVEYSDWATPIVPVPKSDGTIRICGDYKSTLNKALKPHNFQIPAINTLLSSIEGGSIFAKIDLAQAYQQLQVDEQSSVLQSIVTHKGAFRVTRLQFGISSAPGIFQNFIETLLRNIPGVLPYFDDIVLMGKTEAELAARLHEVFSRFNTAGLRLRKDKCSFGVSSIEFLGFKLDSLGIRPSQSKVKAIQNAPAPQDKKQLQAFLGLLNFYHSFLPNKATIAEPLHRLLDKNSHWFWKKGTTTGVRKS